MASSRISGNKTTITSVILLIISTATAMVFFSIYRDCGQKYFTPFTFLTGGLWTSLAAFLWIQYKKQKHRADRLNLSIANASQKYLSEKGNIDEQLSQAVDWVLNIENPDYRFPGTVNASSPNNHNLFRALGHLHERLQKISCEETERSWEGKGIAQFAEILRLHQSDYKTLTSGVLTEAVKYLNANQGALFIANESPEGHVLLDMEACYAYDRKKYLNKSLYPGEGLVGQVYIEKETIYMTEVPDNYIQITSGIGKSLPTAVLVVPLKANSNVQGVLEVASFRVFKQYEIDFIEKIGENIASAIANVKNNDRTRKLLEESRTRQQQMKEQEEEMRQSMEELVAVQDSLEIKTQEQLQTIEEMRAQEEELRQNMEELQAVEEELAAQLTETRHLKQEMEAREKVLDLTTIISESDPYGTITFVNDKFLEITGYSREELIGNPHKTVRHIDMPKEIFRLMWSAIKKGEVFRGIIKNRKKDGTHYWVDATISPVLNEYGKPIKYIGIRYVIPNEELAQTLFAEQLHTLGINSDLPSFAEYA